MKNFRNQLKIGLSPLILPLLFFTILWFPCVFHESAHSLTALIAGIPAKEIDWKFRFIYPIGIYIPIEKLTPIEFSLVNYSGGFFSGLILLVISLFLYKYLNYKKCVFKWWILALTFSFTLGDFFQGYQEGSNYNAYMKLELFPATMFIVVAAFAILNIIYI
ncbi:MAG TPA: hypothetical protein VJ377_11090, partial [Dehalococcoidales bacterium]|nr:hypothetical protein [Dehalococcoidales bacterium]